MSSGIDSKCCEVYHLTGSGFAVIAIFTQLCGYTSHPGCSTFLLLGADTMFCSLLDSSKKKKSSFGYIDDILNLA